MQPAGDDYGLLEGFFQTLYDDETGFVYVVLKGKTGSWNQNFYEWPNEKKKIIDEVLTNRSNYEVYFGPALYSSKEAKKEHVKGARCVWCEFDEKAPDFQGLPEPSITIQSSTEDHQHCYWLLGELLDPQTVEKINQALAYKLGADTSGWDITQVLRPPQTLNHKRSRPVSLLELKEATVTAGSFSGLPLPPPRAAIADIDHIPPVEDVMAKYSIPLPAFRLFQKGREEGQRSTGLMALGFYCAESGMTDSEIFSVLLNADNRWGKFKGRRDQHTRLLDIVTKARNKYPYIQKQQPQTLMSMGLSSLLKTEVHLEWVWEGFLQKAGYFLLTGPTGVGKTQLSLDMACHAVLGYDYLGTKICDQQKIGFFSLEMGLVDLKQFLLTQAATYTESELEKLEDGLRFFPLGEPMYLNRDEEKKLVTEAVKREGLTGIIIDSLGSLTDDELSSERGPKELLNWLDHFRMMTGVWILLIHHHRKATSDNKKPNKISDIYGSQYITARATTVIALWPSAAQSIEFIPLKVRLAAKPDSFLIYRGFDLHFSKNSSAGIKIVKKEQLEEAPPVEVVVLEPEPELPKQGGWGL